MTLGIATYVDNLDRVRYDIPLVVENWEADRKLVYSGSDKTTFILRDMNLDVEIISLNIPINKPSDLPIVHNAADNHAYSLGLDSLIYTEADVYITKKGMELLHKYYHENQSATLSCMYVQLYVYMWRMTHTVHITFANKRIIRDLHGDGANFSIRGMTRDQHIFDKENFDYVLDIGYFTIDHYIKKLHNHNIIWPSNEKVKRIAEFNIGVSNGLRDSYNSIIEMKKEKLVPIDVELYGHLLEEFDAWDEYNMCLNYIREANEAIC